MDKIYPGPRGPRMQDSMCKVVDDISSISTVVWNLFRCNNQNSHSSNQDNFHSSHSNLYNCSSV